VRLLRLLSDALRGRLWLLQRLSTNHSANGFSQRIALHQTKQNETVQGSVGGAQAAHDQVVSVHQSFGLHHVELAGTPKNGLQVIGMEVLNLCQQTTLSEDTEAFIRVRNADTID